MIHSSYFFLFPQDDEEDPLGGDGGVSVGVKMRIGSPSVFSKYLSNSNAAAMESNLGSSLANDPRFMAIASSLVNDSSYISTGIFRSQVAEACAKASANCSHTRCMRIGTFLFSLFRALLSVTSRIFSSSNSNSSCVCRGYPTTYTSARSLSAALTISRINSTLDMPLQKTLSKGLGAKPPLDIAKPVFESP